MNKRMAEYKKILHLPYKFIPIMMIAYLSINILGLALPLTMKKIYSSVLANKSYNELRLLVIGCLLALFLESVLRNVRDSSSKWIASKYEYQLSNHIIKAILNSYAANDRDSYHSDLQKINSIRQITAFYSARIYQLYIDIPFIAIFLYFIYTLGRSLVLVPLILSVIYVISIGIISKSYFRIRKEQVDISNNILSLLTETLDKIHLVKASGLEEVHIAKFNRAVKASSEKEFKCNIYQSIPSLISANFSQLNLFTLLLYGGHLILQDKLTFAEITACVMLGGRAIAPVKSIMSLYLQRKDIQILIEKIDDILSREYRFAENAPSFPDDVEGTIELIDLEYSNIQSHKTEHISCSIQAGEMIYINPSVFLSYKEIIYRIIGKEKIQNGKVLIDNLNIQKWNLNTLSGKVEYLSDEVGLYKGSIMDNITYFNREKTNQAYEAAALTGLDKIVGEMSDGFETQIEGHSKNYLSSAFLQRLNLTRALVVRPRILILDRIDESMDQDTYEMFIWLLEKFRNTMTVIVISREAQIFEMATENFIDLIS